MLFTDLAYRTVVHFHTQIFDIINAITFHVFLYKDIQHQKSE